MATAAYIEHDEYPGKVSNQELNSVGSAGAKTSKLAPTERAAFVVGANDSSRSL